jgi:hypothetical protein
MRLKIEEVSIMFRDNTKGLRRARFLFNGGELNALFARGLLEQGHIIKERMLRKEELTILIMI